MLALFSVLQLAVYAALQVPVGVLLDRLGSRRLITAGAVLMGTGQFVLATAHNVPFAVAGRVLVGAGDAMTFISVLRLIVVWFPPARVPLLTQFTGFLGQVGQILAAYPLVALLQSAGWNTSFLVAAFLGLGVALAVGAGLRDAPRGRVAVVPVPAAQARRASARGVAGARDPAGPVDAFRQPVLEHGVRAALGLSVPGRRRAPVARASGPPAHPACGDRDGDRAGGRSSGRPLAVSALRSRPGHRRRDRADLDDRARLARAVPPWACSCCSCSCWPPTDRAR